MGIEVRPAREFDDVAAVLGPRKPTSNVCWCLSHRLDAKTNHQLVGPERAERVRELTRREVAPGVLAYEVGAGDDGQDLVVGWAAVAPRAELPYARSRKIPHVDDLPVWSLWCVTVRPGHRGLGIARHLVAGAARYAVEQGAPAVEGYPVDNRGEKVDLTMAFVGTRALFEGAGFHHASDTDSFTAGFPRVLMRRAGAAN